MLFVAELERLLPGPKARQKRSLILALHELGYVEKLECADEECRFETREFFPPDGPRNATVISIDHIVPTARGGSDAPSNLRISHHACNSSRGGKIADPLKIGAGSRARWTDPDYRSRVVANQTAAHRRPEVRKAKSVAMKRAWANLTPTERETRLAAMRVGKRAPR